MSAIVVNVIFSSQKLNKSIIRLLAFNLLHSYWSLPRSIRIVDHCIKGLIKPLPKNYFSSAPTNASTYKLNKTFVKITNLTFVINLLVECQHAAPDNLEFSCTFISKLLNIILGVYELELLIMLITIHIGTWADIRPISTIFSPVSGWKAESYTFFAFHNSSSDKPVLSPFLFNQKITNLSQTSVKQGFAVILNWGAVRILANLCLVTISFALASSDPVHKILRGFVVLKKCRHRPKYVLKSTKKLVPKIVWNTQVAVYLWSNLGWSKFICFISNDCIVLRLYFLKSYQCVTTI